MPYRKPKHIILRMSLILILVAMFFWSYMMFAQNYEKVEMAQRMVDALLDNKTALARKYAQELGIAQENLDTTEQFLTEIKAENMKLKEKIQLLDQLNQMDGEIGRLKEENARIIEQMKSLKETGGKTKDRTDMSMEFDTIENGRSLIAKFKDKIRAVKNRIHCLKKKEHEKKVEIQKQIDQEQLLLGNQGYLVKDGEARPINPLDLNKLPDDIKIKVEFVR